MIYGNSTHPVEIKKINLNVWSLRDEIESVIHLRLLNDRQENRTTDISDLKKEYQSNSNTTPAILSGQSASIELVSSENDEKAELTDEEAMAKAMEEGNEASSKKENKVAMRRAQVPKEKISNGVMLLTDINMDFLYFFCEKPYIAGQSIVVEFLIPSRFVMNLEVVRCKNFNLFSRIISDNRPGYRVHAKFSFLKKGERTLLRQFLKSVQPQISSKKKPKAAAAEKGDSLEDLGL